MNVQERLLELMAQRGWSAYKLAKQAELSETTISNLFKRNQAPTLYTLERICDAFGITLSQFFSEDGEAVTLTDEQRKLLSGWAAMSDKNKEILLYLMEHM